MATPTVKASTKSKVPVRDLGLGATLSTLGYPFHLEQRDHVYLFVFDIPIQKFQEYEQEYWAGSLRLPAREMVGHLRSLKDALYSAKRSRASRTEEGGA